MPDDPDTDPAVADTHASEPDSASGSGSTTNKKRAVHSGDVLGRYELGDEVGEGGMATVYRARDRELRRDVAIKVLFPHLARRDEIVRRFHREARAAAGLDHPNILRIYDVGGARRRAAVHRDGADPRAVAARRDRAARRGADRDRRVSRRAARRRVDRRARGRDHPPRHQAGERPDRVRRPRVARRLRRRAARDRGDLARDPDRSAARHPGVHEPGAGDRRHRDLAQRSVFARRDAVSARDRRVALRRHRGEGAERRSRPARSSLRSGASPRSAPSCRA